MKRVAIAALALALAAGCSAGTSHGEAHVLRIADNVDPSSLNPLLAHDQDTIGYDLLVTETLIGLDVRNRLVPVLVTRVPRLRTATFRPMGSASSTTCARTCDSPMERRSRRATSTSPTARLWIRATR
jgi:hypothetical protein